MTEPAGNVESVALLMGLVEAEQGRQQLADATADLAAMGITASMADATTWSQASRRQRDTLADLWIVHLASEPDFKQSGES